MSEQGIWVAGNHPVIGRLMRVAADVLSRMFEFAGEREMRIAGPLYRAYCFSVDRMMEWEGYYDLVGISPRSPQSPGTNETH